MRGEWKTKVVEKLVDFWTRNELSLDKLAGVTNAQRQQMSTNLLKSHRFLFDGVNKRVGTSDNGCGVPY